MSAVRTVVTTPQHAATVRVWDYEESHTRRTFGQLAARATRAGGTVLTIPEGFAVTPEQVAAWWNKSPFAEGPDGEQWSGLWPWHQESLVALANAMIGSGCTLREVVQITREEGKL